MPWEDVPIWMWIVAVLSFGIIVAIATAVVVVQPESRFKPLAEKISLFVTNPKVWKVLGTGVGLGLLADGIIVLGYYVWHPLWHWSSGSTSKPKVVAAVVETEWYNRPIFWVAIGFVVVMSLLLLIQKRLPPGYAKSTKIEEEESEVEKTSEEKKDKKDKDKKFFDGFEETWYGSAFIYIVMVSLSYALFTRGALFYMQPVWWKWLWTDHQVIFYFIPITIFFCALALKFRHWAPIGFATAMVLVLSWTIADTSGAVTHIENWWAKEKVKSEASASRPVSSVRYKYIWKLPPGVVGDEQFATASKPGGEDARVYDDPACISMEVYYEDSATTRTSLVRWNKIENPNYGEWSQPSPPNHGKVRIEKDLSGIGYSGVYTRDDVDRRAGKEVWIPFRLMPVKPGP